MKRPLLVGILLASLPLLARGLGDESLTARGALSADVIGSGFMRASSSVAAAPPPTPTFDLVAGSTTPNDLSDTLTVNSTSMTLVLACDAQGISGTSWTCRDSGGAVTLSEAGTGSSPTTTIATPFHAYDSNERGVTYAAGKRHDAAASSVANLTTEDFVVEIVGKPSSSASTIIDKSSNLALTDGWRVAQNGASGIVLSLRTASTTAAVTNTGSASSWYHYVGFVDRNEASTNGAIGYMNGTAGTGVDVSLRSASLGNANVITLGGVNGAASGSTGLVSLRIWSCAGCFAGGATNPTQWAPIARERTARAFGLLPTIAAGTAAPTTLTRATTAHTDVVDGNTRHLYLYPASSPRVARRTYSGGTAVAGYLSEPAVSNIALQSQTLGTTWTAVTVGDNVLADAFAGADLTTTGDDVDGNNSNAEHGLRQSITLTAATYTMSAWAKAGAQTVVALRNATIANGAAWFDLTACASCTIGEDCTAAVKTVQAGVIQARAQRWPIDNTGDGTADVDLCRVSISYTGTVAAHNHDLLCAPSDNVLTYTDADATADCGFWGVRVEVFPTMTSYLATTTGAVSRSADDVRFDGASHYTGSPSTMDVSVLCPSFDTTTATFASVGTGATNYARAAVDATERARAEATVTTTQWDILAAAGDVTDGTAHSLRQTMETNNVTAYYDATSIGTDATATLPTVASSFIYFGSAGSTANASACLISRARLWSSLVTPAVAP